MVIVIANIEVDEFTGKSSLVTSHGVDTDTDRIIMLPNVDPRFLGAKFDENLKEYVL